MERLLQQCITTLLEKAGFDGSVAVRRPEGDDIVVVSITTPEGGMLIGREGQTLYAFQHVARLIARAQIAGISQFVVDVNRYREERQTFLRALANNIAMRAANDRVSVVLRPMNSFERRVIHTTLSGREDVRTESVGEGAERRVVVHPAEFGGSMGLLL